MIRVLIVDDHPVVRQGLKQIIAEESGMGVGDEAGTAHEALRKIEEQDFDIVLLDIALPDMNGIETLRQISSLKPKLPVLMLSVYEEEVYAVRAIESGASGYVTKATAEDELAKAIRTVCDGHMYIRPSVAEKLASALTSASHRAPHEQLSNREYEIMLLLAGGKTVGAIAQELSLSPKTVSTYRVRALEKLGLKNNAEVMRYALDHNLTR